MSNGKVVFITGSNSGFGRLTAETLARQGYSVYGSMRDTTGKNAALASEIVDLAAKESLDLNVVDLDVTDDASVERAIQHILATAGHIDVVVNNAGIFLQGPLEAYTLDQIHHQFDTNVYSVMRINRAVLPSMRARRNGLLIQVGSIVGRIALPGVGLYSASKFALEGLTEAYHHELAALGIDAVIVEPGTYPTGLGGKTIFAGDQTRIAPYSALLAQVSAAAEASTSETSQATAPNPQEVADAIANLIAMPTGHRPLRTVVAIEGQREGPSMINQTSAKVIQAVLQSWGLSQVANEN